MRTKGQNVKTFIEIGPENLSDPKFIVCKTIMDPKNIIGPLCN